MNEEQSTNGRVTRRAFLRQALFLGIIGAGWAAGGCASGGPDNPLRGMGIPSFLGGQASGQGRARRVAVGYRSGARAYPASAPFDPTERYPEFPYDEKPASQTEPNESYALVRDALRAWNPTGFGTPAWNPLATSINPGDTVLIKPNFVWESWWGPSWVGLSASHGSTVRALVDYAFKACGKTGRIIVCDGTANVWGWGEVLSATQTDRVVDHLRGAHGVPVQLLDLNSTAPDSTPLIRLGKNSAHFGLNRALFDLHDRPDWHSTHFGAGTYYVSPAVFDADVIISLAKMKVHRMAGISAAMKNLFGIIPSWDGTYGDNRLKDVPHYSDRDKSDGDAGIYPGNDTVWRTVADLNRIVLYSDRRGNLQESRRRRYLAVVDGLLAAGRDMLNPEPVPLKTLVVGEDPVSVDAVVARVMGYDYRKIKSIAQAAGAGGHQLGPADPGSIEVTLQGAEGVAEINDGSHVVAPDAGIYSWKGRLEADDFAGPVIRGASLSDSTIVASLEDRSGVAYGRVFYTVADRQYSSELTLTEGNDLRGDWRANLALSPAPANVVLEIGDRVFNVTRHRLAGI